MKIQIISFISLFLTLCLCLGSCNKIDEIGIEEQSEEVGFLNIKAALQKEINVTTANKPPTLDAILDDMTVNIYKQDPSSLDFILFSTSNYRDLPEPIELPSGYYAINMFSSSRHQNIYSSRFDNGVYGLSLNFTITAGSNTQVDASLLLLDTAITVDFTNEVLTEYPNITVNASTTYTITGATESKSWTALEDERTAYFDMTESYSSGGDYMTWAPLTETLSIEVIAGSAYVTRDYVVRPNEHYMITVSYSGDSSATLNVTLGDETIIEDEIPFPG